MGYTISGVLIDKLPEETHLSSSATESKYQIESTISLCPKKLTVGFRNNSTFIFLDNIYYKNISEEKELTQLESDINTIFPGARFLIIVMNETSDIYGYSYITKGKRLRTKCVVKGQVFLDFGELNPVEQKLQKEMEDYLNGKPEVKVKIDDHTKSMTPLEAAKFRLVYRDKLYSRNNLKNSYEYLGGSLDSYVIEKLFQDISKCDFQELENSKAMTFNKKKIDFNVDSLRPYIYEAFKELKPKTL